jgi:hypothetical protein
VSLHGRAYRALGPIPWRRTLPPRHLYLNGDFLSFVRARVQCASVHVCVTILLACVLFVSHPPTRGNVPACPDGAPPSCVSGRRATRGPLPSFAGAFPAFTPLQHCIMFLALAAAAPAAQASIGCLNRTTRNASLEHCRCNALPSGSARFAFISCEGPPFDGGFREMVVDGVDAALRGDDGCFDILTTDESCSSAVFADAAAIVADYRVVLAAGYAVKNQMAQAAQSTPSSFFALADVAFNGRVSNNTQGMLFAEDQAGYMAGYMAGLVTRTGIVGSVLGPDLPPVKKFGNGFAKGALDACRKVGKPCVVVHKYVSSFAALARGALIATKLALLRVDVSPRGFKPCIFARAQPLDRCSGLPCADRSCLRQVVRRARVESLRPRACPACAPLLAST